MKRMRTRLRSALLALLLVAPTLSLAAAPRAEAWAWDPHVRVWFNVSKCAGSAGMWGWYRAEYGEQGWVRWEDGYRGYFDLYKVPTYGSITRISWGGSGCTGPVRYFNITRPSYGTMAALGWIG